MSAEAFYEALKANIENDVQCLKPDEHLVACYRLANGEAIIIDSIGYYASELIWLYGRDSDESLCTILCHMSAVHIVLKAIKQQPDEEERKIGFRGQIAVV